MPPCDIKDLGYCILSWCISLAMSVGLTGFLSTGWEVSKSSWIGLWCYSCDGPGIYGNEGWFKPVQVILTLAMVLLALCYLAECLFSCCKCLSRSAMMKCVAVCAPLAVLFFAVGLGIYANKHHYGTLHYSFYMVSLGTVFCLVGAIIAIKECLC